MDKMPVSQCATEDLCRGYNAAVEEANKEINKIKKQNERLKRFLKSKIKVYVHPICAEEHNGCLGCQYQIESELGFPCKKCKGAVSPLSEEYKTRKDYWRICND